MLARLSEPSVYRSLLDALLITPVTKPPLQAIGPSRKSTSALELQKSKRYCLRAVHGWHLGLARNWLLFESLFLLSARLKQSACCGLWHEVTHPKSYWFHLFAELICTLVLPMVCKSTVLSKGFLTGIRCPSETHGAVCVASRTSEGGTVTLNSRLEKKQDILAWNLYPGELFATVPWASSWCVRLRGCSGIKELLFDSFKAHF